MKRKGLLSVVLKTWRGFSTQTFRVRNTKEKKGDEESDAKF